MIPSTSGFVRTRSTARRYFPVGFDFQITKITVPLYSSCAKIRRERPHLASTFTDLSHPTPSPAVPVAVHWWLRWWRWNAVHLRPNFQKNMFDFYFNGLFSLGKMSPGINPANENLYNIFFEQNLYKLSTGNSFWEWFRGRRTGPKSCSKRDHFCYYQFSF